MLTEQSWKDWVNDRHTERARQIAEAISIAINAHWLRRGVEAGMDVISMMGEEANNAEC